MPINRLGSRFSLGQAPLSVAAENVKDMKDKAGMFGGSANEIEKATADTAIP